MNQSVQYLGILQLHFISFLTVYEYIHPKTVPPYMLVSWAMLPLQQLYVVLLITVARVSYFTTATQLGGISFYLRCCL